MRLASGVPGAPFFLLLLFACSSVVAGACTNASASNGSNGWLRVASDSSYDISIDTTRIARRYGHVYVVWYKTDHAVTHLYERKQFNREVVQGLLHCGNLSFKVASVDMSLGGGHPISQQRASPGALHQQPWRQVERGTIEEVAALATCDFARWYAASRH
jgi:hypothetical protein